ncbi:MAG: hypothetical protein LBB86_00895 [Oscillospiraceae bacterium]|nr:hypothetical protein [Oscillospiraceae bacterium]
MKKILTAVIVSLVLLLGIVAPALAAGKITVTKEAFYVVPYLYQFAGAIYGEYTNTGDKPVEVSGNVFELFDASGEAIASERIYSCYPSVLQPGERGFFFETSDVQESTSASDIDDYSITFVGQSTKDEIVKINAEAALMEVPHYSGTPALRYYVDIENTTDELANGPEVVLAFFDSEGNILYVAYESAYGISLYPGSKIQMNGDISTSVRNQLSTDGVTIDSVEAIAWYEP